MGRILLRERDARIRGFENASANGCLCYCVGNQSEGVSSVPTLKRALITVPDVVTVENVTRLDDVWSWSRHLFLSGSYHRG